MVNIVEAEYMLEATEREWHDSYLLRKTRMQDEELAWGEYIFLE